MAEQPTSDTAMMSRALALAAHGPQADPAFDDLLGSVAGDDGELGHEDNLQEMGRQRRDLC